MKEISFQNAVLPLKNKLFRLALRITRNREEAEDVVPVSYTHLSKVSKLQAKIRYSIRLQPSTSGRKATSSTMLVIVHYRDIESSFQALLDVETLRCLDVLQVDSTKCKMCIRDRLWT